MRRVLPVAAGLRGARAAAGREAPRRLAVGARARDRPRPVGQDHDARRRSSTTSTRPSRATSSPIEDPIEVLHPDKRSIVNQREVGTDTDDFHDAIEHALRQDPDVILVERDAATPRPRGPRSKPPMSATSCSRRMPTISATDTITASSTSSRRTSSRQVRGLAGARCAASSASGCCRAADGRAGSRRSRSRGEQAGSENARRQDRPSSRHHRRGRVLRDADLRPEPARALPARAWWSATTRSTTPPTARRCESSSSRSTAPRRGHWPRRRRRWRRPGRRLRPLAAAPGPSPFEPPMTAPVGTAGRERQNSPAASRTMARCTSRSGSCRTTRPARRCSELARAARGRGPRGVPRRRHRARRLPRPRPRVAATSTSPPTPGPT